MIGLGPPPPEGVCQVAAVEDVAVNTCPEDGAVAALTLTVVVALLSAPAYPVVFWLSVGNVQFVSVPLAGVPSTGVVSIGLVRVLLVSVSVPAMVARSASVTAVLNWAMVPVIPTMDVWSPVLVQEFVPVICEVNATVPVDAGRVTVIAEPGTHVTTVVALAFDTLLSLIAQFLVDATQSSTVSVFAAVPASTRLFPLIVSFPSVMETWEPTIEVPLKTIAAEVAGVAAEFVPPFAIGRVPVTWVVRLIKALVIACPAMVM